MDTDQKVKDYMSTTLATVTPDTTIDTIKQIMRETNHDGFPVVDSQGNIVGIVTTRDLVFKKRGKVVKDIMTREVMVTFPGKKLVNAARVMFRHGFSKLPVVEEDSLKLIGIVTNTDVLRSHIERVTPEKVKKFQESLNQLYNVETNVRLARICIMELKPTQKEVGPDEFRGREYELKRGLAEPIVVVMSGDRKILVDGHHRSLAAHRIGIKDLDAYVIVLGKDIELGLERTANEQGLNSIEDVIVTDESDKGIISRIIGGKENDQLHHTG